jgi:hypothetical protein
MIIKKELHYQYQSVVVYVNEWCSMLSGVTLDRLLILDSFILSYIQRKYYYYFVPTKRGAANWPCVLFIVVLYNILYYCTTVATPWNWLSVGLLVIALLSAVAAASKEGVNRSCPSVSQLMRRLTIYLSTHCVDPRTEETTQPSSMVIHSVPRYDRNSIQTKLSHTYDGMVGALVSSLARARS